MQNVKNFLNEELSIADLYGQLEELAETVIECVTERRGLTETFVELERLAFFSRLVDAIGKDLKG